MLIIRTMQAAQQKHMQMHQHMHSLNVGSPLGRGRALHRPGLWLRQHRRAGLRPCRADLQDVVVCGAVLASIGAALYYGTKVTLFACHLLDAAAYAAGTCKNARVHDAIVFANSCRASRRCARCVEEWGARRALHAGAVEARR